MKQQSHVFAHSCLKVVNESFTSCICFLPPDGSTCDNDQPFCQPLHRGANLHDGGQSCTLQTAPLFSASVSAFYAPLLLAVVGTTLTYSSKKVDAINNILYNVYLIDSRPPLLRVLPTLVCTGVPLYVTSVTN